MSAKPVELWLAFQDALTKARADLHCENSGAWFRGVSSSKYRLYPSLLRPRAKIGPRRERDIFEEFTDFDIETREGIGSWDRLVRLQHYGVPTRLLDWTETLGVALFFALRTSISANSPSPAIWILNPFWLAQFARKNNNDKSIGVFHREDHVDYFERFLAGAQLSWPFEAPMPYRPPKLTPRIRAQRGFFTVHGVDRRPLDAIFRECIRQVRLSPLAIPEARKFLQLAGIDALALFPDHEGFARRVKDRYEN